MSDDVRVLVVDQKLAESPALVNLVKSAVDEPCEIETVDRISHGLGYLHHADFCICIVHVDNLEGEVIDLVRAAESQEVEVPVVVVHELAEGQATLQVIERGIIANAGKKVSEELAVQALRNAVTRGLAYHRIRKDLMRDQLTRVYSRSHLEHHIEQERERNQRGQESSTALLILDLDNFKNSIAEHGEGAGDEILQQLARRVVDAVRGVDAVGRIGRDEFAILAYDAGQAGSRILADRIIKEVEETPYDTRNASVALQAHLGIAIVSSGMRNLFDWMEAAQDAVATARTTGEKLAYAE